MKTKEKKTIKITFTEEQYEQLIRYFFLGTWVQEANLLPREHDPKIEELAQFLYKNGNSGSIIKYSGGRLFFNEDNEEKLMEIVKKYNEDVFREDLVKILAERDMEEETGIEYYHLSEIKQNEYYKKYREEFEKNGIKNLIIKWTT